MMDPLPRGDVHMHVVGHALRRFGLLIVAVTVLFGALAGAYTLLGKHTYRSSATVLLHPLDGNALSTQALTSSQSTTVAMETEASLATSVAVTRLAAAALHTNLTQGGPQVSASVPVNSQIVQITCTANTARDAQRQAQAYAQAFLAYRSSLAAQSVKTLQDQLNARITTVQKQLQQALTASRGPARNASADTQVRLYTSNLSSLQSQVGNASSTSKDPGNVITPASRPAAPTGPGRAVLIGLGAIVGLLLAMAVAVWRERIDDRIRTGSEPTLLGLPVLAVLPNSRRRRTRNNTAAIRAEALRRARTSLLALAAQDSVIAIAGVARGDLTLSPAAGLANAIAAAGYSITLVDAADAQENRPSWLQGDNGLTNVMNDSWSGNVPSHRVDGVRVVSAGSDPGTASDRYAGRVMHSLLRHLQETSDFVLVAAPAAETAEGMAVILAAGTVLLVGTDRRTTHEQVESSVNIAETLDAAVFGLLVQRPASGRSRGRKRRGPEAAWPVVRGDASTATSPVDHTEPVDAPSGPVETPDSTAHHAEAEPEFAVEDEVIEDEVIEDEVIEDEALGKVAIEDDDDTETVVSPHGDDKIGPSDGDVATQTAIDRTAGPAHRAYDRDGEATNGSDPDTAAAGTTQLDASATEARAEGTAAPDEPRSTNGEPPRQRVNSGRQQHSATRAQAQQRKRTRNRRNASAGGSAGRHDQSD